MPTDLKRYTLDEIKAFTEYFRAQGALEFSVGDSVFVRFGPASFLPADPSLDPNEMTEGKLEFIKQTLAQANKEADENEYWST